MIIMLNAVFFSTLAVYFLASLMEFIGALFKKSSLKKTAWIFFIFAFVLNTSYIVARGIIARRLPLANQFEFSTAFAWGLALMYIITRIKFKADWVSIIAMPATFLLLSYAALLPREITDLGITQCVVQHSYRIGGFFICCLCRFRLYRSYIPCSFKKERAKTRR